MKKPLRYGLATVGVIALSVTGYHFWKNRGINQIPQKTIEEVLKERADQAAGDLLAPTGQAIVAKNFDQASAHLKEVKKPHLHLANIIRALFIQNKLTDYTPADFDALEMLILSLLEKEPEKDQLGYELLSTQIYRLPLLDSKSLSRKKIEMMARNNDTESTSRNVALSKLIIQATPPSEKEIKNFEQLYGKISHAQWLATVDAIRTAETQTQMIQVLTRQWSKLDPLMQAQSLTLFSSALATPKNKELVMFSLKQIREGNGDALTESSLRYLSALNDKNLLTTDQKSQIVNSLTKIEDTKKSPFLAEKIRELIIKLR